MSTKEPKVAVITRTKDRPVFLRRALKSVYAQTYQDYEHVIVNDGGDQATVEAVVEHLPTDQREKTKIFHRPVSSGAPDTIFTESIDRIGSEYFTIHDDDDTWEPEFLAATIKHLDEHADIGAVVVRADKVIETIDENGAIRQLKTKDWMADMKVISLYRQCIDNQFTPIATVFRRSAYEAVGKFDDTLPVVGDWEFGIRLLQKYDADVIDAERILAHYHHREFKQGSAGNTSFAGNDLHRYYTNKVMNKYLRDELADGRLGAGYIMSKLRYDQRNFSAMVSRLVPRKIHRLLKNRVRD